MVLFAVGVRKHGADGGNERTNCRCGDDDGFTTISAAGHYILRRYLLQVPSIFIKIRICAGTGMGGCRLKTTVLTGKRVSTSSLILMPPRFGLPRSVELNLVLNASGTLIPFSGESQRRNKCLGNSLSFFESAARVESRVVVQPLDVSRL